MCKIDFSPAIQLINQAQSIAICGHINPDGDCIGSTLALAHALKDCGKDVIPLLARNANISQFFFLTGCKNMQPAKRFNRRFDLFVCVDVAVPTRMGDAFDISKKADTFLVIDHHLFGGEIKPDCIVSDPSAASTSILIWELLQAMNIDPSVDIAQAALTALITDTGRFQFQNADARAFFTAAQMCECGARASVVSENVYQSRPYAALLLESIASKNCKFYSNNRAVISTLSLAEFERANAQKKDTDSLIDKIREIKGVELAVVLREERDGIRGSIRSKTDIDVEQIARSFGGGGHKAAAGFTLHMPLQQAQEVVVRALQSALK